MSRHAKAGDERVRAIRMSAVAVIWLAGLFAGFSALLSAAARWGCGVHDDGLACHTSGSLVGVLIVLAVIAVVTGVTVLVSDRPVRHIVTIAGAGLVGLACCYIAARGLLATA